MWSSASSTVDRDQAQVARLQACRAGVDRHELAADLFHVAGALGAFRAFAQQGQHFAILAAALALVW